MALRFQSNDEGCGEDSSFLIRDSIQKGDRR